VQRPHQAIRRFRRERPYPFEDIVHMRLGERGLPRQTALTDFTGTYPFTGQFNEALAELRDVQLRDRVLLPRLYFYQK